MKNFHHQNLTTRNGLPLCNAETWVFDLDNTLYPASCRLFDQVDKNITKFIMRFLSLTWDDAYTIQKTYFRKFGTSMNGLINLHGLDPQEFLEFVHKIDLSPLAKNPEIDTALAKLSGRKIIFTNGSVSHAEAVLGALGIARHFEGIFDIVAANYQPKPDSAIYEIFIKKYNIDPKTAVMVEDMARNLAPAHKIGMSCVWIASDNEWARAHFDETFVHHIIDDLTSWLQMVVAEKNNA